MGVYFTNKALRDLERLGLYERDALDVFNNGEHVRLPSGWDLMKKKYEGWGELMVSYWRKWNGEYAIAGVKKRPTRYTL